MSQTFKDLFPHEITLGIIGGTGLYHISDSPELSELLEFVEEIPVVETPYGNTSSPIYIYKTLKTKDTFYVSFLARHGLDHMYSPTSVPYRANIAALKKLKTKNILSFSSVGSLKQECKPTDFVLPDQLIDLTKGLREHSYFNETGIVGHISFGDPFSLELRKFLLNSNEQMKNYSQTLHENGIVYCMEGPQFSTRAESLMYKRMGGDDAKCINMSCVPESKLAKELEINYQIVCMITDYDSWRLDDKAVDIQEVIKNLKENNQNAKTFISNVVTFLDSIDTSVGQKLKGHTLNSISVKNIEHVKHGNQHLSEEGKKKLEYIFPEW